MITRRVLLLVAAAGVCLAPGTEAYLKLGATVGDEIVGVRWRQFPIDYFVTDRDGGGLTAAELEQAIDRAFGTWEAVETAPIATEFRGFTGADPSDDDGMSVLGFADRPEMDRTLGAAAFSFDTVTGELLEGDIFFNSIFDWSVAAAGETNRFDLESIAVHEIGHMLGLGHSALGETSLSSSGGRSVLAARAVMFPIAYPPGNIEDRTLKDDDIAGLGDLYASTAFNRDFGAIQGRVTLDGVGIFGAHLAAFSTQTGKLVGGFSLTEAGNFVLAGLEPGLYVVRVEPLDDADADSFFDDDAVVNADFRATYYPSLVGVPAGGTGPAIEIKVQAK